MAYGRAYPSGGSDPLFTAMFLLAALLNLLLVLVAARFWGTARTLVLVGLILAHAAFLLRLALAKRRAGQQRAEDLTRFRELLGRTDPQ